MKTSCSEPETSAWKLKLGYNEITGKLAVAGSQNFKGASQPLFLFLVVAYLAAKVNWIYLEEVKDRFPTLL